ncbi:MAG: hypothetical protein PHH59_12260 [Methylovulum sp.]|uniref:hypothetical protein n=1 Tax=Methylovulum sp. TaxID=1916980 RepID=UPI002607818D|nr:hypothetical protein [Methylovulum sp.]MDD2724781.1 hypothetical protein [Methylovulum sp.]MDD5126005.1 hypothetical protein [Methylovulum sp.]
MNNQKLENQCKEKVDVSKRRRFLQKAGVVAPVILTFTSPSVFGESVLCASQVASGNLSRPITPNCQSGPISPASLAPSKTSSLVLADSSSKISNFPTIGDYNQDTVFNSVFQRSTNSHSFGEIIEQSTESRESVYIAAFLNAQASNSYVLKPIQVIELYDNPSGRPAGYSSDTDFLRSTFSR